MTQKFSELSENLTNHNHGKYITIPEFNTLTADVFNARLTQVILITKTNFDAKLSSLNRKITSNKSKHLFVENELEKLKIFIGKSHFEEDGTQNYLVFQPLNKYFKIIANKNIFHRGYLKDYLMKILSLLLYLIIVLLN